MNDFFNCFKGIPGLDIDAIIPNTLGDNLSYLEEVNSIKKLLLLLLKNKENIFPKFKFMGDWEINKAYPQWSIVNDPISGNGYIAIKPVPYGVELSNDKFWVKIANYDALYSAFEDRISTLENDVNNIENDVNNFDNQLNHHIINMTFNDEYIDEELQAYIDNANDGDILIFPESANLKILNGVVINKSLNIDLNHSILTGYSGAIIKAEPELITTHYVTIGNNKDGILTLDSVADIEVGMLVRVDSPALYDESRQYYHCGGVAIVEKIEGNKIYLSNRFPTQPILIDSVCTFFNPISISIINGVINGVSEGLCTNGIYLKHTLNSRLNNIKVNKCQINIRISGCINTDIQNFSIFGGKSIITLDYSGYGIEIDESLSTNVENGIVISGQHAIAVGGFLPSYHNIFRNLMLSSECSQVAYDNHATIFDSIVENVHAEGFYIQGNAILRNVVSEYIYHSEGHTVGISIEGNSSVHERASVIIENAIIKKGRISTTYDSTDYQSNYIDFINIKNASVDNGISIGNGVNTNGNGIRSLCIENVYNNIDTYFSINNCRKVSLLSCESVSKLVIRNISRMGNILNSIFKSVDISSAGLQLDITNVRTTENESHLISVLYSTLISINFSGALTLSATRKGALNAWDVNGAIT